MIISFIFFALLIFSVTVYWLLPSQKIRNYFVSAVSLFFVYNFDKSSFILVISLTLLTYISAYIIELKPKKSIYFFGGILLIVLTLFAAKYLALFEKTFVELTSIWMAVRFTGLKTYCLY